MYEEAQLYSPVTHRRHRWSHGSPRARPSRRERSRRTASAATRSPRPRSPGAPVEPAPRIEYTEDEHEVWRTVCRRAGRSSTSATRCASTARPSGTSRCRPITCPGSTRSRRLIRPLTGWRYLPAAGLGPTRGLLRVAGRPRFPLDAVRAPPEGAAVHAGAGHHPRGHRPRAPARHADVRRAAPAGGRRRSHGCSDPENLTFLSRVFWFSLEFGVVVEDGELRAYGAGILSSYGEIEEFRGMRTPPARPRRDGHAPTTTSPRTSRCSTGRSRLPRWSTSSAGSSPPATTIRSPGCAPGAGACPPMSVVASRRVASYSDYEDVREWRGRRSGLMMAVAVHRTEAGTVSGWLPHVELPRLPRRSSATRSGSRAR